ncbi:coth-domain-containing protein [Anaeromyces robustus]|uniref:Coth-domain-containing protein n=1 Tax=Anaeromyces robustus TaxID=1754192 RepID=A0A1Y1XFU5_9FUNG|nr:coth-domain-containing protein [Anaeromyces robustus]|eukprot:ORX84641.1 coth-domain-containing protein [Anaeromyces robustus]
MKFNYLRTFSLLSIALFNIKHTVAIDSDYLNNPNATRAELFELIDFKMPNFKITLNDDDYKGLFLAMQCERDQSPAFLKRNDDCYTAPWVDLNQSLERAISKKYIHDIKEEIDKALVDRVIKSHNYNITLSEFENLVKKYSDVSLEELFSHPYGVIEISPTDFSTDKAQLTFELEKETKKFPKVKFSVGGRSTKSYSKLGYNLNIKGDELLYGTKQLRLRAEVVDPTFIRDKLGYDVHNFLGLPTLSANYARLYINGKFMGLYLVRDAFKSQWIKNNYGEENTKHLYECEKSYGQSTIFNCRNDDEKIKNDPNWTTFIEKLEKAKTPDEIKEFFDVDTFIRWQVARYLFGSWDHNSHGHNNVLYLYHDTTTDKDKWIPFLYDFDLNFGNYRDTKPDITFNEVVVDTKNKLYSILEINETNPLILSLMEEFMQQVFNPLFLFTRIDRLKVFLKSYVKKDRTADENGNYPGRFARMGNHVQDSFDYEDFKKNTEFTTIKASQCSGVNGENCYDIKSIGLKQWIAERFKFICKHYHFDCSYADIVLNGSYMENVEISVRDNHKVRDYGCRGTSYSCCVFRDTAVYSTDETGTWGIEGNRWCLFNFKNEGDVKNCWSIAEGYPCCQNPETTVSYTSKSSGKLWGVENNEWCGITEKQCPKGSKYKCCTTTCEVHFTDDIKWGLEKTGEFCSLPYICKV